VYSESFSSESWKARRTTSNPHHRNDTNDKMDRSHKFEIFAAMENTATKFNREYPFGEGKLTGYDLEQGVSHRV
jgi:hypothetical protein